MTAVAFIGLGNMGTSMARNLLRGKVPLFVYNRSMDKAKVLVKEGAKALKSPSEAFQKANIVITMLANDQALEDVTTGPNGLLETIQPGHIHVSMSTVSAETNRKLAVLHQKKQAYFVAAPVFGRPDAAAAAKLFICISGNHTAKEQVEPILSFLGQKIVDFGADPGSANIVKLCGNFLILSAIESMGEAWSLLEQNEIDVETAVKFFGEDLFKSPVYQNYGKALAEQKFESGGFKLSLGLKDMNLVRKTAEVSHNAMPIVDRLAELMSKGIEKGRGDWDWTSIVLTARESALNIKCS